MPGEPVVCGKELRGILEEQAAGLLTLIFSPACRIYLPLPIGLALLFYSTDHKFGDDDSSSIIVAEFKQVEKKIFLLSDRK